jgi:hypothetical protein
MWLFIVEEEEGLRGVWRLRPERKDDIMVMHGVCVCMSGEKD